MGICLSCNQEREFLIKGICIVCRRMKQEGVEVKNFIPEKKTYVEIESKTGYIDENMYLR